MANPVTYAYSTWQPDAFGLDTGHPVAQVDPMNYGSSNDASGWVRRLESEMRRRSSSGAQWEEWLGINTPYAPSPNPPIYVAANQFKLIGDWTSASAGYYPAIAIVGRRVKAITGTYTAPVGLLGTITAASFLANATTVTVLWDGGGSIDASISEVQFGIPAPSGSAVVNAVTAYRNNDQSITSTTLVADNLLTLNVAGNQIWNLRANLYVNPTSVGPTLSIGAIVPVGTGYLVGDVANGVTAGNSSISIALSGSGTTTLRAIDLLIAIGGSGGSISIAYAVGMGQTVAIKANSNMIATRLV